MIGTHAPILAARQIEEGLRAFMRTTMLETTGGPRESAVHCITPFFEPDREEDYPVAWAFFAKENA